MIATRKKLAAAFVLIPGLVSMEVAAAADALGECVGRKNAAFVQQTQPFSVSGSVTCPPARLRNSGLHFRVQKYDRSGRVTYEAPPGFEVVNTSIDSVRVSVKSSSDGSNDNPQLSADAKRLDVPIRCRGAGLSQGKSWHEITVTGTIRPVPTNDQRIAWSIDCARELKR